MWDNTHKCISEIDFFFPPPDKNGNRTCTLGLYLPINYRNNAKFIVYIIPSSLYKTAFEPGYYRAVKFSKFFFFPSLPAEHWTVQENEFKSPRIYFHHSTVKTNWDWPFVLDVFMNVRHFLSNILEKVLFSYRWRSFLSHCGAMCLMFNRDELRLPLLCI